MSFFRPLHICILLLSLALSLSACLSLAVCLFLSHSLSIPPCCGERAGDNWIAGIFLFTTVWQEHGSSSVQVTMRIWLCGVISMLLSDHRGFAGPSVAWLGYSPRGGRVSRSLLGWHLSWGGKKPPHLGGIVILQSHKSLQSCRARIP